MIGIICALDEEVRALTEMMQQREEKIIAKLTYYKGYINGEEVVATECGVGKVNAAMSTQIMIDYYHPDVIINSGIAGSLSKNIRIGDIVICKDCVQHDYDGTALGNELGEIWFNDEKKIYINTDENIVNKLKDSCVNLEDTNVLIGRVASGDVFVSLHEKREIIGKTFNALCCEMEGAAVGSVCYRNSIPFAILRCISDDFNENESVDYWKFRNISAKKSINIIISFIQKYKG